MKTIEERAKAFCEAKICPECGDRKACDRKCLTSCIPTEEPYDLLVEFANSERAELMRWNDSKKSEPASGTLVLGKYHNDDPDEVGYVACQYVDGWFYAPDGDCLNEEDEPTHWRPIHE